MDIKKYIKNIYNGFYEIFIEGNDKKHLQKFIDEKQWEKDNTIYYVISCEKLPFLGLFGYVEIILAMAKYALERDMVPVVDFKNYPNSYLESNEIGKINAWELFFQQFTKKTLDEIYENCKYIVGNHMDIDWSNLPNIRGVKRRDIGTYWKVMYQNYIKFSKEAEKYCQKEYDALLKGKEAETLGVLVRGTDIKLFKGHALQPSLEQVEEKIRKILKKDHRFKYLYLATEEKKSEDYLKEKLTELQKQIPVFCVMDGKEFLKDMPDADEAHLFDAGIAAYLLNPLKSQYSYDDIVKEYVHRYVPAVEEIFGGSKIPAAGKMTPEQQGYQCGKNLHYQ